MPSLLAALFAALLFGLTTAVLPPLLSLAPTLLSPLPLSPLPAAGRPGPAAHAAAPMFCRAPAKTGAVRRAANAALLPSAAAAPLRR